MNYDILEFKSFIKESVTSFHVVKNVKQMLENAGFKELIMTEKFNIKKGEKYYVDVYGSSLMAFTIGDEMLNQTNGNVRITSSHTDFPCFKLKSNPLINTESINGVFYIKLNTEVYGGAILNTWLDRPLGIAGRLMIKGGDAFSGKSVLVKSKDNILTIPNLAIHMNREVNKGIELNKQKDMLPIIGLCNNEKKCENSDIIDMLFGNELEKLKIKREDVLDYELFIYSCENGVETGINGEMLLAPRIDNLSSVFAQTKALINAKRDEGINIALYFDNEEIGSKTKQGAASDIMMILIEKIYNALGIGREEFLNDLLKGIMISCDVAHATHPNFFEKADPTNRVIINNGIVIKEAASQSYANDVQSVSVIKYISKEKNIPYQIFVNKSDMQGGQTLGAISSTIIPIRTIDIGIPILAMHSSRELMGIKDEKYLEKFLTGFYS